MSVVINGTSGVTFPDATAQTTAAVLNTTTVLAATAGATAGAVGTYAVLARVGGYGGTTIFTLGGTYSGSILRYAVWAYSASENANDNIQGAYSGTPAGTWRCMSAGTAVAYASPAALFLRIS
jgi:hypothetical protein